MNNKIYGVLKSKVSIDKGEYTSKKSHLTHYNLITIGGENSYQVNIDIQSNQDCPDVHMLCISDYQNKIIEKLSDLDDGFTPLNYNDNEMALDYLRQDLFSQNDLFDTDPLSGDQITEILDKYLESHENVVVFGKKYGSGYSEKGHYGTSRNTKINKPITGLDCIHFNQGNVGIHADNNGIYQDGALLIENLDKRYTVFFFSFSEQCHNTDSSGNCIP